MQIDEGQMRISLSLNLYRTSGLPPDWSARHCLVVFMKMDKRQNFLPK
jgi:hypothetical protein